MISVAVNIGCWGPAILCKLPNIVNNKFVHVGGIATEVWNLDSIKGTSGYIHRDFFPIWKLSSNLNWDMKGTVIEGDGNSVSQIHNALYKLKQRLRTVFKKEFSLKGGMNNTRQYWSVYKKKK